MLTLPILRCIVARRKILLPLRKIIFSFRFAEQLQLKLKTENFPTIALQP
jgi:hypothetical protein